MALMPVKSSNVEAIDYDPTKATLRVKFKAGGVYDYPDVTPQHYAELTGGGSIGAFIHKHIKPGRKAKRVTE